MALPLPPPPALLIAANNASINGMFPGIGGFAIGHPPGPAAVALHLERYKAVANMGHSGRVTPAEVGEAYEHLHKVEHAYLGAAGQGGAPVGESHTNSKSLRSITCPFATPIAGAAALAAQIAALGGQIAALGIQIAKMMNSSALLGAHTLQEVPGPGNVLPSAAAPLIWFPATRTELDVMSGPRGESPECVAAHIGSRS